MDPQRLLVHALCRELDRTDLENGSTDGMKLVATARGRIVISEIDDAIHTPVGNQTLIRTLRIP